MNLSKQLHKLGESAYTHPWRVISAWVVVLVLVALGALQFFKAPSSDIAIPGTQAQQAIDRLGELFPGDGGGSGRVVFKAKEGTIFDHTAEITSLVNAIGEVEGVSQAVSPFVDQSFVSPDNTIAYSQVQLTEQSGSVDEQTIDATEKLIADARTDKLQIEIGGALVSSNPGQIIGAGEMIGVGVALLVLIITLGSLIAGGMPILSAVMAVGVSMAGLFALSQLIDINSTTPILAVMLGLAVGIDYSLFIVNKHRTLRMEGRTLKESAGRALGTAGNAVVFAAFTVIIALAALSVVNIPFMTIMGLAGAASIAVAALVSLTLTPAMLGLAKDHIFSKKQLAKIANSPAKNRKSFWYIWGVVVTKRPVIVLLLAVGLIAVIAFPAKDLKLGLPTDQHAATNSTQRKAYDLLSTGFGVGFNAPLVVLVEGLPAVSSADREAVRGPAMEQYNQRVVEETNKQRAAFEQQLAAAQTPEQQLALQQAAIEAQAGAVEQKEAALAKIDRSVDEYAKYVQLGKIADSISALDNVKLVQPAATTANGTAGIIQVIPASAPDDKKTQDLIETLRSAATKDKLTDNTSIKLAVTGATALEGDINQKLTNALPLYILVIVGLSLVLLLVAFRSVLVPIKATLGYVLSVGAMFGATVAVFQWGWFGLAEATGPIVSFVPIIAAGILFGLAMDYEFFLVSGMQEAYHDSKNAKQAVTDGFGVGAKVVTAAAIIMVAVFASFITSQETVIQSVGFGLAIGILVDAFLVRMTIVPAVMKLLGKNAWWLPKWLDKILPHVSIEGESEEK